MAKWKNAGLLAFTLWVALGLGGCGFFVPETLTSIRVTPQSASVPVGGTVQLSAIGVRNDGSTAPLPSVNWTSSSPQVATVSSTGVVTGVASGTATITATSGGASGSTTLTAGTNTTGLTVTPANPTVSVTTGTVQFTATSNGQDVTASSAWSSSNPAVAQVSLLTPGLMTLVGQGTTTITATANGQTGSTILTVAP